MTRIILAGSAGQRNLGDDALLAAFASQLGHDQLFAISSTPEETEEVSGISAFFPYGLKNFRRKLSAFLQADAVVFAGGSPLKEIRGSVTDRSRYQLLVGTLFLVLLSRLFGKKVLFSAIGVGPINSTLSRTLCRWAIGMASSVSVRDLDSMELLENMGIGDSLLLAADATWILPWSSQPSPARPAWPRVGLAPLYYVHSEKVDYVGFRNGIVDLCKFINEYFEGQCEIHLLAFCYGHYAHDDIRTCLEIKRLLPPDIPVAVDVRVTPQEMLDLIASLDFVVGVRLHSSVFSCIVGTPLLPVVYDVKCRGFARDMGLADFAVELGDVPAGKLRSCFVEAWQSRDTIRATIQEKRLEMTSKAQQNFDLLKRELGRTR
jgi:polysaccharide pyruvyl transferase WcaK-like protein